VAGPTLLPARDQFRHGRRTRRPNHSGFRLTLRKPAGDPVTSFISSTCWRRKGDAAEPV
jgi:hypothetical protein